MKNPGKTVRAAVLLLVLCMISTAMMGGTFAKYTSEYAGADTALIARWQFEVSDGTTNLGDPDADPLQALDLFSHAYDTHINGLDGADYIIAPGVNDTFTIEMAFLSDVDAKVTVDFAKDSASTVAAGLPIEYRVVDGDDEADWVSLTDLPDAFVAQLVANNPAELTAADVPDNTFTFKKSGVDAAAATTISQVVEWRWAFDAAEQAAEGHTAAVGLGSDDETDTGFGNTSAEGGAGTDGGSAHPQGYFGNTSAEGGADRTTYILDVSVLAEQIQPATD